MAVMALNSGTWHLGTHRLGAWMFRRWDVWASPFGRRTLWRRAALVPSPSLYLILTQRPQLW